ncbi:hypothetical protein E4U53_002611, partial [Claviceps sorghi]
MKNTGSPPRSALVAPEFHMRDQSGVDVARSCLDIDLPTTGESTVVSMSDGWPSCKDDDRSQDESQDESQYESQSAGHRRPLETPKPFFGNPFVGSNKLDGYVD